MEYKNISLEELKEYTQNHNAIILENCDITGCESIEQMETILNTVHFLMILLRENLYQEIHKY